MGYIRNLPKKAWWILLSLAAIWIIFELYIEPINPGKFSGLGGLIFLAYIIWFSMNIGSSRELKIAKKILYFFLFYLLTMGLSLAVGLLITLIFGIRR